MLKASCGCTTPNWTKGVIKPGEKGTVTATYNAASPGPFIKQLQLQQVRKILLLKF